MESTYRVKEVLNLTGFTRKDLHYLHRKGVVEPVGFETKGEYKIYDENGIDKLIRISILRGIGMKLKEIMEFLEKSDFDKEKALDFYIEKLEKDKENVEGRLRLAKRIKEQGIDNVGFYSGLAKGYEYPELAKLVNYKGGNDK